jgi:hypothetical protein
MFEKKFPWLVHAASPASSKASLFEFFWKLSIFVPEYRPPGTADIAGGPCSCFQSFSFYFFALYTS